MSDVLRDLVEQTTERVIERLLPTITASNTPRLLSLEDSARYIDVSLSQLRELIELGEIPVVSIAARGRKCDRRDLDGFIDQRKSTRKQVA